MLCLSIFPSKQFTIKQLLNSCFVIARIINPWLDLGVGQGNHFCLSHCQQQQQSYSGLPACRRLLFPLSLFRVQQRKQETSASRQIQDYVHLHDQTQPISEMLKKKILLSKIYNAVKSQFSDLLFRQIETYGLLSSLTLLSGQFKVQK